MEEIKMTLSWLGAEAVEASPWMALVVVCCWCWHNREGVRLLWRDFRRRWKS